MRLTEQVQELWNGEQESRVCEWVSAINKNREIIAEARKDFHKWEPFRVYINTKKIKSGGTAVFSLRFQGQEVAEIKVGKEKLPVLYVGKKHTELNNKYFGIKLGPYDSQEEPVYWDSKEAAEFRKAFKLEEEEQKGKYPHSPEHQLESHLIHEMGKGSSSKFGGQLLHIQPVTFEKCPLQIPSPIIWNEDEERPVISSRGGNIDILARRQVKNKVRLSVWELKKPSARKSEINKALHQAIVYSSTLIMMLRSRCGAEWYKLFGFKDLPEKLDLEAVVMVSNKQKKELEECVARFKKEAPFNINNDRIILCVAYYDEDTFNIRGGVQEI